MSYKYYIDFGSGYTEVNPFVNGCMVERKKDDGVIYSKDMLNGDLVFYETEYNLLEIASATEKALPFKVEYNSAILWEGLIDLAGKYNVREKRVELPTIAIDPFALIEKGMNNKYDMYEATLFESIPVFGLPFIQSSIPDIGKTILATPLNYLFKFLINKSDESILFDSDSFKYLNESLYWKNIVFISSKAAFNSLSVDKTDVALAQLLDYFRFNFEIYPTLELIGDRYYFRFKHISEVTFTLGTGAAYDMTTFNGVNWSLNKQIYMFNNGDRFWRIRRSNPVFMDREVFNDFNGVDIVFNDLKNIGTTLNIENFIVTDIESIYTHPDILPIDSNTLCMLCCDEVVVGGFDNFSSVSSSPPFAAFYDNFAGVEKITINASGSGNGIVDTNLAIISAGIIYDLNFDITFTGDIDSVEVVAGYSYQEDSLFFTETTLGVSTTISTPDGSCILIFKVEASGVGTVVIENSNAFLHRNKYFTVKKATGILTSDEKYNMPLSQSYIDSIAGKFNKYSSPALINNVSTPVTLKKIKSVENISVNMRELLINFDYLVKTTLGNIEPTLLKIKLDKGIADLNGKI